jgi:hypothetical protein
MWLERKTEASEQRAQRSRQWQEVGEILNQKDTYLSFCFGMIAMHHCGVEQK